MKIQVSQDIGFPPEVVGRGLTDPELYPRFAELPKVRVPEVLSREVEGDRIRLRIRYRFGGELNSAARRVIDPDKLSWVDDSVHDLGTHTVRFELQPDHYADRFRCRGRYVLVATATGCRRDAEIDLRVSFPVVGRAVEGAIASGLRDHLDDEAAVIESFLGGPSDPRR